MLAEAGKSSCSLLEEAVAWERVKHRVRDESQIGPIRE